MTSESGPVTRRLAQAVEAHLLEFDPAQAQAAVHLDRLADSLNRAVASPQRGGWLQYGLRRLGRGRPVAPIRGLYLWGEVGRGKTHLMDLFYDSLSFDERERSHFYRFMQQVHAGLRSASGRTDPLEAVAAGLADTFRVICLDEFFVSDIADAMILGGLLRGLFRRGVTLVATSNAAPGDLYRDGLQRPRFMPAIALLEAQTLVLHLAGGTDYRLRRLRRAPVYFDAALPASGPAMAQLWDALAGADHAAGANLALHGRVVRARRLATGMVWFDFEELCAGPRSQDDYVSLARSYQTLFLSAVPRLGAGEENEARRLLMLIDELYDRRVKLVISAAAAPQDLYRGERLRFEFERVVSRLSEMQTEHYLSQRHRG